METPEVPLIRRVPKISHNGCGVAHFGRETCRLAPKLGNPTRPHAGPDWAWRCTAISD